MNVLTTRVALRERTLPEVFDLSFRFVVLRGARGYFRLWLVSCLPCLLLCIALRVRQVDWLWIWASAAAGFVAAQVPFTLAASRLLLGDTLPLGAILRTWLARSLPQLMMHSLVLTVLGLGAFLVFPIPFVLVRCLYLTEITLLEGSGMLKAYERGTRLTRQRLPQALETLLLLACVAAAFVVGAELTGRAIVVELLDFPPPADALVDGGSWFALFGFFAAVPFVTAARFLSYIDERTRREAWDVQLRFNDLAKSAHTAAG
jgi:hypothetical protein